ncbi:MAG: phosphopyruvate hydratase, partial [Candidatus Paceibacterota bacterium]
MSFKIDIIKAEEIYDSRGNATLRVSVCVGGVCGLFDVPSGASTGTHEALELRDVDGHVSHSLQNIDLIIKPALLGKDPANQKEIDTLLIQLDGTPSKSNLGANTILGVSVACAKLAASLYGLPTYQYLRTLSDMKDSRVSPLLFMNLLNGGKHAKNGLAFQEYHVVPNTSDAKESVRLAKEIQKTLEEICKRELDVNQVMSGDEGGLAPVVKDVRQPLVWLREAVMSVGSSTPVHFALDVAASSFYQEGTYHVDGKILTPSELMSIYEDLIKEFDIISIEDPFHEEDFNHFHELKVKFSDLCVVGDDLTVTNLNRLKLAVDHDSIGGVIIKLNQIGTLT